MRILFLPFNIASKASISITALNKIEGIEARGLFLGSDIRQTIGSNSITLKLVPFFPNPFKWAWSQLRKAYYFRKLLRWADVVHWIWDSAYTFQLDLRYVAFLKKPGIIEWSGSDIRNPERAEVLNPFMKMIYKNGYEYAHIETRKRSQKIQKRFRKINFFPLTTPEMGLYVDDRIFPKKYQILHRLNVGDFIPAHTENPRPLVIHAPTRRIAKGTSYILQAVEELKKDIDFDFVLLENMPRQEAMKKVRECDIFIDQLFLGSHGLSSCEAMSFGKPVLCYIMPAVYENGLPLECPIVNVNIHTLKDELKRFLTDKNLREETGKRSRDYALKYHDADKVALDLLAIYKEVQSLSKNK